MNRLYRHASFHGRSRTPSKIGRVIKFGILFLLAVGVFVVLVFWFRQDAKEEVDVDGSTSKPVETTPDDGLFHAADAAENNVPQVITLTQIGEGAQQATATKSHTGGLYSLSIVAQLNGVDAASEAYEAWYIKPGITDFFSLGEMFPREDGGFGLVWSVTDALARTDLGEFNKILITREARDGNTAPSTVQILQGEF
jgi:hypothetical protein